TGVQTCALPISGANAGPSSTGARPGARAAGPGGRPNGRAARRPGSAAAAGLSDPARRSAGRDPRPGWRLLLRWSPPGPGRRLGSVAEPARPQLRAVRPAALLVPQRLLLLHRRPA